MDIRDVRALLGLHQSEFARLMGVSTRSVAGLEKGQKLTPAMTRQLREVTRLARALNGVVRKPELPIWLRKPNPAFGKRTPLEVIEQGESGRIWAMIYFLSAGVPT